MHALALCSIALALHLQPATHIVEQDALDDRVAWVLPPDRLAAMERAGMVIDEDTRTAVVTHATVDPNAHGLIGLHGDTSTTTADVPRHRVVRSFAQLQTTLSPRNEAVPAQRVALEAAPMTDLPIGGMCVGAQWTTRMPVSTTLGSGLVTIQHTIASVSGDAIVVKIRGSGVISGLEYNLPRLLPGAMSISGSARFDRSLGYVVQEDYVVRNRLIRTVNAKTIGFLETETVHAVSRVTPPATATARASHPTPAPHTRR